MKNDGLFVSWAVLMSDNKIVMVMMGYWYFGLCQKSDIKMTLSQHKYENGST